MIKSKIAIYCLILFLLSSIILVISQDKKSAQIARKLDDGRFLIDKGKADGIAEGDKLKVLDKSGELKAILEIEKLEEFSAIAKGTELSPIDVGDTVEVKSAGGAPAEQPKLEEKKPEEQKPPEKKSAPDKSLVDKELQAKIDKSVKKAYEWLLKQQNKDTGSFDDQSMFGAKKSVTNKPYTHGPTVLCIYALVKSGVPPEDLAIQKALNLIRTKNPILTSPKTNENVYTISFLILALDAIIEELNAGGGKDKAKKNPKAKEYLGWMQTLHNNLTASAARYQGDVTVEKKGKKSSPKVTAKVNCTAWVHKGEGDQWKWDNSCSQIVVLALAACSRNGIKVPKETWMGVTNHWLSTQQQKGEDSPRFITDIETGDIIEGDQKDQSRGWGYLTKDMWGEFKGRMGKDSGAASLLGGSEPPNWSDFDYLQEPYSSMTAAGVCSLLICHSELQEDKTYKEKMAEMVEKGIRDGIASYNDMFPIGKKLKAKWETASYFYSLYSMERVGVMAKLKNVGKHFWYKEGAEELLTTQKAEGFWGEKGGVKVSDHFEPLSDAISDTCFALLFLKKATFEVPIETFQQEGHKTEAEKAKW